MEEADRLCKRIAIIDHGKVAALDKPSALKSKVGGDIIQLNVRNPRLGRLKDLGYIMSMDQAGNTLRLTVKDAGKHLQEILGLVGETEGVEVRTATLNGVFLHHTGHEIRPESGEGGIFERIARTRSPR